MRRLNRIAVSPVIATVLLVAMTVVLAATLYLLVSSLVVNTEVRPPFVSLRRTWLSGQTHIEVTGVTEALPLGDWAAFLVRNASLDGASTMDPVAVGTLGNLTFADATDDGRFNVGDRFTVEAEIPGSSYEFLLIWKRTGNQAAEVNWGS